jgi:DNA-binding Lrp family transcriptional regulator
MTRTANEELTRKIINSLEKHSEGTYISEIARELKLQKSTVAYVLNTRLKDKIKDIKVGQMGLFRLIKLK